MALAEETGGANSRRELPADCINATRAAERPVSRRRILFLLQIPPPVHGSSVVGACIRDSKVINEAFNGTYINTLGSTSLDEVGRYPVRKGLRYLRMLGSVLRTVFTHDHDLCYFAMTVNGAAFYRDALTLALLKLGGQRMVLHLHNKGVRSRERWGIQRLIYRFVFSGADVIVLSRRLYGDLADFVRPERVHVCPNGVGGEPSPPPESGERPVRVLFLSNLIESKGVYLLLEAARILRDKGVGFECEFVGGKGDISPAEFRGRVAVAGLQDWVSLSAGKYGEEKAESFRRADIFAFPTFYHNECFPLVILEAMQHGRPVVTTSEGGIPDMVEDGVTGFLCPPGNVEVLADRLETLIRDAELRRRMGEEGRRRYEERFTLALFEKRLSEILLALAGGRGSVQGQGADG